MSATTWTEEAQSDFLAWLKPSKQTVVRFLGFPEVSISVKGESGDVPTIYKVESHGLGFRLNDLKHLAPCLDARLYVEPTGDPDEENQTQENLRSRKFDQTLAASYSSLFRAELEHPQSFEEMVSDFLAEFVPELDHEPAKTEIEKIVDAMDSYRARAVLDLILSDRNPTLAAWALACAWNLPQTGGRSQSKIAARCGVTRAAMSKRVRQLVEEYGTHTRFGLTNHAAATYSDKRKLK